MWKKAITTILLTCCSSIVVAQGQYIAIDGQITKVGNTSGNGESFFVVVQEGTGPCVTTNVQTNIYFPASAAGTEKVFDRAYSTALAALASGKKVSIYNYIDGSCNSAAAIEIISN
jgi:hypothetical protein